MTSRNLTSVGSEGAREQTKMCADCGRSLTAHEQYLGDACESCEQDYQFDTHSDDDYPRAA